ncbi:hypothetical protein MRBBS_3505 [Marinobacter sp. BSs20148]|nr:hypothetical protein MRBBS_3505 [Marinobacter sp. BSs20148]
MVWRHQNRMSTVYKSTADNLSIFDQIDLFVCLQGVNGLGNDGKH